VVTGFEEWEYALSVKYPALEAVLVNERVVSFDWMAVDRNAPAQKFFCYDSSGNLLWRSRAIGMGAVDAYTGVTNEAPLWVGNFSGFDCRIDETSGRVLDSLHEIITARIASFFEGAERPLVAGSCAS
jgi:hypothetical protein